MSSTGATPIQILIITGSMGAGKTTLMAEASDVLIERDIVHAAIDLDALGIGYISQEADTQAIGRSDGMPPPLEATMYRNLRSVWMHYRSVRVTRLLLAAALERRELPFLRDALGATEITVCRVRAPLALMEQRVRVREPGMFREKFVRRVGELEASLDRAALEDFVVANDGGRPVTDVATEMLTRAGWL